MTNAQRTRNPYTTALWALAGAVLLVAVVLFVLGAAAGQPSGYLDDGDPDKAAFFLQLGTIVAAAGAVLAGLPLMVWAVAREHGVR